LYKEQLLNKTDISQGGNCMVAITDLAAEKGKEILTAEGKPDWGLRIYMAGSSCCGPSFGMDLIENPLKGDKTVEKNGMKVFVEKEASEKLDGLEIHYLKDGEQQGFVIRGNKPSSCSPDAGPGCSSCG
jgi:iron-sulfur cluster assembly accessory protein